MAEYIVFISSQWETILRCHNTRANSIMHHLFLCLNVSFTGVFTLWKYQAVHLRLMYFFVCTLYCYQSFTLKLYKIWLYQSIQSILLFLFICLFILAVLGLGSVHGLSLIVARWGGLSSRGVWACHCGAFLYWEHGL